MQRNSLIGLTLLACAVLGGVQQQDEKTEQPAHPEDRDWQAYAMDALSTLEQVQRCDEAIHTMRPRMNELLDELYEMMDDESDTLLHQNQKDWVAYNKSKADLIRDRYRGGSLSRVVGLLSSIDEHQRRINELKAIIEDRRPR